MTRSKIFKPEEGFHVFNVNQNNDRTNGYTSVFEVPLPDPNQTTRLDDNSLSVFEMVKKSSHLFTYDILTLIKNSDTTRRAVKNRKKGINSVPRPPNAFMLYRRDLNARFKCEGKINGVKSSNISKKIGDMWKEEPDDVKKTFYALARLAEQHHNLTNKGYKYQPKPSVKRNQRKNGRKRMDYDTESVQTSSSSSQPSPTTSLSDFSEFDDSLPQDVLYDNDNDLNSYHELVHFYTLQNYLQNSQLYNSFNEIEQTSVEEILSVPSQNELHYFEPNLVTEENLVAEPTNYYEFLQEDLDLNIFNGFNL